MVQMQMVYLSGLGWSYCLRLILLVLKMFKEYKYNIVLQAV